MVVLLRDLRDVRVPLEVRGVVVGVGDGHLHRGHAAAHAAAGALCHHHQRVLTAK